MRTWITWFRAPSLAAFFYPIVVLAFLTVVPDLHAQEREERPRSVKSYQYRFGMDPFFPSQAQSETGTFIPAGSFPSASYCAKCHQDIHQQWRQSAHANSFREPFYLRNVELLIRSKGIEFSRHCEGCHNPIALFSGALTKGSTIARSFDKDGVTCMVCHSINKIQNTSGTGSYVMGVPAIMVKPDGTPVTRTVSNREILSHPDLHSRAVMRNFYRTPEFCAVCHKAAIPKSLNDYRWLRAFSVYDEWQESSWSKQSLAPFYKKQIAVTCQNCHMPPENAVRDYAAKGHQVSSHRWIGANTAIPKFYGYDEQLRKTEQFLKGSASIDIFGISINNGELIAPIQKQKFRLAAGDSVTVNVVIQNNRIGHSLVPEQRDFYESWVEFQAKDVAGQLLYHSGSLDPRGFLDPRSHSYTNRLVSASGKLLDVHEVWKARIRAYDNTILPGRSDLVRYRFQIPVNARGGPITLTAKLNYRRFTRRYTNFVLRSHPNYPIVEIASRDVTINTGENKGSNRPEDQTEYLRWNNYGIALLGQVQYLKAAEAFRKVVTLNPEYVDGYINIAIATYTELLDHKREGADGLGGPGLALGNTPDGTGNLFLAKALSEDFEPALRALDHALALESNNRRARYHKGVVYRLQNRLNAAIEMLEPVVAAYPKFRQARQELGYAYFLQKLFQPAREQFEALQAINPDDITANNYLFSIYSRLGMKDEAAQQAQLFSDHKEDVGVEPVAQDFWSKHSDVADELAPFHIHQDVPKLSNTTATAGTTR